jgi:PAS domain S-box-containing protein
MNTDPSASRSEATTRFAEDGLVHERIRHLRDNTDFVSALFDNLAGYAIVAADFDGNVIAYNEGARLIYGYAPEEIIGQRNVEIFFPKGFIEQGKLKELITELVGTGRFSYEGEKVRKDGAGFPAQGLFTLTKDKSGRVIGFVEIVEDLTERKRALEASAQARERAARISQLEEELRSVAGLSSLPRTNVTARMYGATTLRDDFPETFGRLVGQYEELMDLALEQQAFKVKHDISGGLGTIAETLGFHKAGPRDVVDIHAAALKAKTREAPTVEKKRAYAGEGWMMVLELMGDLATFYRNRAPSARAVAPNEAEDEGETTSIERGGNG